MTLIDHLGLWGIGIGVFLNGLAVPGISEVMLPLGGVAVKQGHMDLVALFMVALAGQLIGLTVAYWIARTGGLALVERYGKYVLISSRELAASQAAFEKYGVWLVVVGSFVPGIQGFVGYVAGVARMNFARFVISVFIGKLVWISALVYLGSVLSAHLDLIDKIIKQAGLVILVAAAVLIIWYLRRHRSRSKKENF